MAGPQSVNVDNRNSGEGDQPSPADAEVMAATRRGENQAGVGVSGGSTTHQAPPGPGPDMAPLSWSGPGLECDPGRTMPYPPRMPDFRRTIHVGRGSGPIRMHGGGNGEAPQKVFALGKLSFDYGYSCPKDLLRESM